MGNYNLKSGVFRCNNCFSIYKIIINPIFPESEVLLECKCIKIKKLVKDFLSELKNNKKYKIYCFQCNNKQEDKNSFYCNNCSHIYCNKCLKNHSSHKYISLIKKDFYCIFHENEKFCAFCKDCGIDLCQKCLEGKRHLNHDKVIFSKILMNKTERNFLKDKFNLAQEKMTFNTQFVNSIIKKLKNKDDIDKLINIEKTNSNQNKLIIELIKFFEYLYDNSKYKNYYIIHNFKENINLNVNKFKYSNKKANNKNLLDTIIKYFKEDFIIINNSNIDSNYFETIKEINPIMNLEDEDELKRQKTMLEPNNLKINLNDDDNLKDNKLNENKNEVYNSTTINYTKKLKKENIIISKENNEGNINIKPIKNIDNKICKKNLDDNDIYFRSRRKVVFIPSKIIKQKLKEKEEIQKEKNIEENKKENNEENIDEEKNVNLDKNEIVINDNNNDNKYINYFSINKYRNKYNSSINLMMVNSFRNRKIFKININ